VGAVTRTCVLCVEPPRVTVLNTLYLQVATQGVNFEIYDNGTLSLVSGTSASSPTFASIIAIVNDRLGSLSRPPLGFLNRMCLRGCVGATANECGCSVPVPVCRPGGRIQRRNYWQERRHELQRQRGRVHGTEGLGPGHRCDLLGRIVSKDFLTCL
jgi:hypothetical protein